MASPTIVDWHPDRPRFQLPTPPALMQRLHAKAIKLKLVDGRTIARTDSEATPVLAEHTGQERLQVAVHRELARAAQARFDALVDGDVRAPSLVMMVKVNELSAWYGSDDTRELSAAFELLLTTEDGYELLHGPVRSGRELRGAPYDRRELDELHLGVCLLALDHAFSEHNVSEANRTLAQLAGQAPAPSASTPL